MNISMSLISRKIGDRMNPLLAPFRKGKLFRTDFSVISNNCWAGSIYRRYELPYLSPTVGLYFFANDYIKFINHLMHYTAVEPVFIRPESSSHADCLREKGELDHLVALLDDIEIVFLHYSSQAEALEKWKRRCSRINWNNVFIKFSQMNGCTNDDLKAFDSLPFKNKVCFTASNRPDISCAVRFPGFSESTGVLNDTDYYSCCLNLESWLNSEPERYELG